MAPLSHMPWVYSPVGATPPPLVGELIPPPLAGGVIEGQGDMDKYQNQQAKTDDADDAAGQQEKTNQRGFHPTTGYLPWRKDIRPRQDRSHRSGGSPGGLTTAFTNRVL